MEIIFLWWKYFMCEKYFKNLTCNSVISFSAILGSDGLVWADPPDPLWPPEWLVAGQEECLVAPQKAAAELPPMSIMLEPWTCIMLALLSQHLAEFLTLRSFSPSRLTPGLTGVKPENWISSDSDSDSRNWPGSALSPALCLCLGLCFPTTAITGKTGGSNLNEILHTIFSSNWLDKFQNQNLNNSSIKLMGYLARFFSFARPAKPPPFLASFVKQPERCKTNIFK